MRAGSDIILISSMSAVSKGPDASIDVAARSGIEGFSPSLRKELAEKDIKVGLIEPGFTGADLQYPEFPPDKQRELIKQHKMLRAEDIAVAAQFMLRQPRRCAVSLMRSRRGSIIPGFCSTNAFFDDPSVAICARGAQRSDQIRTSKPPLPSIGSCAGVGNLCMRSMASCEGAVLQMSHSWPLG